MPEKTIRRYRRDLAPTLADRIGTLWCAFFHETPMWPIHGEYQCRACGRCFQVPWAAEKPVPAALPVAGPKPVRHALRSAALPLLVMLAIPFAGSLRAADVPVVESTAAGAAFARYAARPELAGAWNEETVEIDASLPGIAKHGRLRAIRRLMPFGKPEYQVLEIAGDPTVKHQVIVRYLTADVRAAAVPPSSIAITPANYKFRYKGAVRDGGTLAYAFLITPRKKRDGLIKGELWLDGETGAAVRQSGRLVHKPSIFVKRVDVTRETTFTDGVAVMRVTHLSVDTRLVGRAELTIQERPYAAPEVSAAPGIPER